MHTILIAPLFSYKNITFITFINVQAEWSDRQKKNKQNPDQGFSTYEEASFRKYNQLVKQIKPNMEEYKDKKERAGDAAFYAAEGAIVHGTHK